jgi:hypothetical protein
MTNSSSGQPSTWVAVGGLSLRHVPSIPFQPEGRIV